MVSLVSDFVCGGFDRLLKSQIEGVIDGLGEDLSLKTNVKVEGGNVHIEARSSAFDAYLVVKSPSGQQHDNDDMVAGGNDTTAGLDLAITEPGTWTVIVTSYQAGESGQYQLVVRGP